MEGRQVREGKVLMGTTEKGKAMYMVRVLNSSLRFLMWGDGGALPKHLSGGYSSLLAAKTAVDGYLDGMKKGVLHEDGTKVKKARAKPVKKA
jgi:hypothetical protein